MMKILLTGGNGFIGNKLLDKLLPQNDVVVADCRFDSVDAKNVKRIQVDFNHIERKNDLINDNFDIIIHCAGIAHQRMGGADANTYLRVNSLATEYLAKQVILKNPDVHFIFLSSISVFGEDCHLGQIPENSTLNPSSDYAKSKVDGEKRLLRLYESGQLKRLDILRLTPVYDSSWSLNLDRRVFGPQKKSYFRFGSGEQKLSAVSRQNVVNFIFFLINHRENFGKSFCNIYNVCDETPYSFNTIIDTFRESPYQPDRMVFTIPLFLVWGLTRVTGLIFFKNRQWIYSCYNKLASDLVFDNSRMLSTGFRPEQNLQSVFNKK